MSSIEANITIDLPDNVDIQGYLIQIEEILTSFNGKPTHINVIEADNPITTSPIYHSKQR